jgi:hypothetical protein
MTEVFDVLPGVALPVREVTSRLALMWEVDDPDFLLRSHALQMNVVLHFGLDVRPDRAHECFDAVVRFAQFYPCRIIVLCPSHAEMESAMESKLFSQCYIGESHREMCCCEALILGYDPSRFESLFNQVSIWLEGDLPTYYWFSDLPKQQVESYLKIMQKLGIRRFVYDYSTESSYLAAKSNWSNEFPAYDLARAFLLPIRQAVGQFLSRYPVDAICKGLKVVRISYSGLSGEGYAFLWWLKSCLNECLKRENEINLQPEFLIEKIKSNSNYSLEMKFVYDDEKYFVFTRSVDKSRNVLEANFGDGNESVCIPIKPLRLEQALSEAFFF